MTKAKLLNPFNVERLVDLGNAMLHLDQVEEATANFEEALKIEPGNVDATQGKGKCLLVEGDVNEALGLLREVSGPRELASVFNGAAVLSMHHKRFKEGMALYDAAVRLVSNQNQVLARLFYNMGIGYFRWDKPQDAKACFDKAVTTDPSFQNAQHNAKVMASVAEGKKTSDALDIVGFDKSSPLPPVEPVAVEEALAEGDSTDGSDEKLTGEDDSI